MCASFAASDIRLSAERLAPSSSSPRPKRQRRVPGSTPSASSPSLSAHYCSCYDAATFFLETFDPRQSGAYRATILNAFRPDPEIIALGVRQPWVELILRGIKTIEVRSQNTRVRGTIYLYAAKKLSTLPAADVAARANRLDCESLPMGLLLGSVEIWNARPATSRDTGAACVPPEFLRDSFAWELRNPRRFQQPEAVRFLPYGVWFYPFRRRSRQT